MFVDWGILQIIPTRMMKSMDYRPCAEDIKRGCDTSARNRIKNRVECKILIPARTEAHRYECVSFQSKQQITSYQGLINTYQAHTFQHEPKSVIAVLRKWYPALLLDMM